MAPILIDNRGLIKLSLILLFTAFFVFAAGYFSGYQKATVFYSTNSQIEIALPSLSSDESGAPPQRPAILAAGEEIDVDQPTVDVKPIEDKSDKVKVLAVSSQVTDSISTLSKTGTKLKTSAVALTTHYNSNIKLLDEAVLPSTESSADDVKKTKPVSVTSIEAAKSMDVLSLSSSELSEIKYSVQVGMYGKLINAENMSKKLQSKKFDAYVANYTNKKNETRYNVRFGYFVSKKKAMVALKKYKESQKGDGYLVNFSVDSIVNLADKNDLETNRDRVVPIEVIDDSKTLDITKNISHNKMMQAHYLSKLYSQ